MSKFTATAKVVGKGARLAVKYGPQAKIAWDKGGKQAGTAGARRARSITARRKAFKHASTVVEGSVLKVAPAGLTTYVVFAGEVPIGTYPKSDLSPVELLAHADLSKRIPAAKA